MYEESDLQFCQSYLIASAPFYCPAYYVRKNGKKRKRFLCFVEPETISPKQGPAAAAAADAAAAYAFT